jgi:hypothetical protein
MASGGKEGIINPFERALSVDQNRFRKFQTKDLAELLRYWMNVRVNDDLDAGGVLTENLITNANSMEILNGLLVRPQIGNASLFVDPGVAMLINPDSAPDDSIYKYINDAGIQTLGTLTIGANASGSIRIDVVECQRTDDVVETANRDVFNTSTGAFSVANVTKAQASALVYRVRQGAPGGGYPGTIGGWVPLCVASVPNGSVNNDTVTFWDVRPLINDRAFGPQNLLNDQAIVRPSTFINATTPSATTGLIEAVLNGRRLGGRLRRGSPGVDADFIDVTDAANQSAGITIVNNRPWYLYMMVISGLQRCARYTDAGSGHRVPRSPRGIPVVSSVPPLNDGTPSNNVPFPAVTGLTVSSSGVCVAAGWFHSGAPAGVYGDKDGMILSQAFQVGQPVEVVATSFVNGGGIEAIATYDFVANTHFPICARALLVEFRADLVLSNPGPLKQYLQVFAPNNNALQTFYGLMSMMPYTTAVAQAGATDGNTASMLWVPIASIYPTQSNAITVRMIAEYGFNAQPGAGGARARILGWKF